MHRRLVSVLAAAVLAVATAGAAAQPGSMPEVEVPVATTDAGSADAETTDKPASTQELGARLGLAGGGRVTPGGLYVAGVYLYRLAEADWFETGVAFSFGGGDPGCFRDRDNATVCDQGLMSGFSGEVSAGLRRYFLGQGTLTPYARAGVSFRVVSFGDDDLKGVALPLWIGGGVRAKVAPRVHVMGDASLHAGPAVMGKRLGLEPQIAIMVVGGVEFELD